MLETLLGSLTPVNVAIVVQEDVGKEFNNFYRLETKTRVADELVAELLLMFNVACARFGGLGERCSNGHPSIHGIFLNRERRSSWPT